MNKDGEIHFVSADKYFRNSCKLNLNNVHVYKSLNEFVTSESCTQFIEVNIKEKPALIKYITEHINSISIELSPKTVDFLAWKSVHSSYKPDECESATITGVYDPDTINFDIDEALYYGGGIILLPFSFQTEVTVDAYIYKPDYYALDKTFHVEDHNEHYYSFEDTIEVSVEGNARIEFDIADLNEVELINCDIDSVENIDIV